MRSSLALASSELPSLGGCLNPASVFSGSMRREWAAKPVRPGAGMLAPGGEIEQPSPWIDLAIESLRSYPAFIAELEEQTGCQIDFECLGAVELAPSPREWQALEGRARRQSALGIPSCALARHDLRQYVPLARQDVVGAWFYRPARPDGRVTLRLPGAESGNPGRSPRDSPFARAQIP